MLWPNSPSHCSQSAAQAAEATAALEQYLRHGLAANTQRAYQSQWRLFLTWCEGLGRAPLPAEPQTVALYLAQRAQEGAAPASLDAVLAALRFAHVVADIPVQFEKPVLRLVLKGIRRHSLRPQRQAEPLTGDLLRQILRQSNRSTRDLRDRALLSLLYVFASRPAEAVALDWQQVRQGRGWLRFTLDRAEIGLLGSKTSPGSVERAVVPIADNPLAIAALAEWIAHANIGPGDPVLRALTRGGGLAAGRLHVGSVASIVKRVMARHFQLIGLTEGPARARAAAFSGHSGRVGMCVTAAEAGVPQQHIAALARHKSLAMARRYAEKADSFKCAPHRLPGVGV